MSDFEQKLAKSNADRQAKHYQEHRDAINAKRRAVYASGKAVKMIEPLEISIIPKTPIKHLTLEEATKLFNTIEKKTTRMSYINSLKRIIQTTDCDDLVQCLKKYTVVLKAIDESKYAVNTKKLTVQTIIYMIDKFNLNISKKILDHYRVAFDELKIKSNDHTKQTATEKPSIPFSIYLDKVEEKFGKESKMYVVSKLYEELPIRDDFGLIVLDEKPTDKDHNYINTKPLHMRIFINNFKTKGKFEPFERSLSLKLSNLLRAFMKRENVELGSYLFGTAKLSPFVSVENKKIGINGGISEFRHMTITDNKDATAKVKAQLAQKMKHSVATQEKYVK